MLVDEGVESLLDMPERLQVEDPPHEQLGKIYCNDLSGKKSLGERLK
jgi:hypothetical protein